MRSSENNFIQAHFSLGFMYQEGKYLKRDMKKSIHYYKEASSFNNQYAKNNLGIIYKHGIGVESNLANAKIYFEESIKEKSDPISMYNLAHIYIYEECDNESFDKSIELLKESSSKGFSYSTELLYIALFHKYGNNINEIGKEIIKYIDYENETRYLNINEYYSSENKYLYYKDIDFLYDIGMNEIITKDIYREKIKQTTGKKITTEFYEGFGINLK